MVVTSGLKNATDQEKVFLSKELEGFSGNLVTIVLAGVCTFELYPSKDVILPYPF
jgi:hypothetical protein